MRATTAAVLTQLSRHVKGDGAGLVAEHPRVLQRSEGCAAYEQLPAARRQKINNDKA